MIANLRVRFGLLLVRMEWSERVNTWENRARPEFYSGVTDDVGRG